jgi:uncharacterized YccA/Bax inhibitor family protein
MEFILQIFGELLIQALGQGLIELGFHALGAAFRKPASPWLAALGCILWGLMLGGLSLLLFPAHLASTRVVNFVITPILVGLGMVALGKWRAQRGDPVLRIDQFFYGYLLALTFAAIRFQFAR